MIRALTLVVTPVLLLWFSVQWLRGRTTSQVLANRFGFRMPEKTKRPNLWIHAASLGELTAIRPFLFYLAIHFPSYQLLITTNNPAALDVAQRWPELPAVLQAAPLDFRWVVKRFLNHWQPCAFINVESELWPTRFAELEKASIPAVMLNARLSKKSTAKYRFIGTSRINLSLFRKVFAQNEASAKNFINMNVIADQVETIPNFKSLVILPEPDPRLVNMFDRDKTILAASTHAGEDKEVLTAFASLHKSDPQLRLIHAPRHPRHAAEVAQMAHKIGLESGLLSGSLVGATVVIVDSLGELQRLYALSAVTFVGGSLVPGIGGHTPYEPMQGGAAIVTGPFTENFADEYEKLNKSGGCYICTSATLAKDLQRALTNAPKMAQTAATALPTLTNPGELFQRVAKHLELDS